MQQAAGIIFVKQCDTQLSERNSSLYSLRICPVSALCKNYFSNAISRRSGLPVYCRVDLLQAGISPHDWKSEISISYFNSTIFLVS